MTTRADRILFGVLAVLTLLAAWQLLAGPGSGADGGDRAAAPTMRRDEDTRPTTPIRPQRLRIPSLDVDAPVLPIAADGSQLAPPSDPQTVGWWSAGPRPGADRGTAILTGHTVSTGGGVFDDLDQMQPGQRVQILSNGPRLRLQVTSVTVYHKATLAEHAAEIFDQSSAGRVALVTCEDWDGAEYLSNVVVIATPMS